MSDYTSLYCPPLAPSVSAESYRLAVDDLAARNAGIVARQIEREQHAGKSRKTVATASKDAPLTLFDGASATP